MSWRARDARIEARAVRLFMGVDYPELTILPKPEKEFWGVAHLVEGRLVSGTLVYPDTARYMIARGSVRRDDLGGDLVTRVRQKP